MIIEVATLLSLTNTWRADQGLANWQENSQLTAIAQSRWQEMCQDNYFAHQDEQGHDWTLAINDSDYQYQLIAENLALGQNNAQEVITAWLASPAHRATISDSYYTEVGLFSGQCQINQQQQNLTVEIVAQPVSDQPISLSLAQRFLSSIF